MFNFLKEKLKSVIDKISKKTEKEIVEEVKEEIKEQKIKRPEKREKKEVQKPKIKEKKPEKEIKEEIKEEKIEIKEEVKEKKKSFFEKLTEKVTTTKLPEKKFDEIFSDLEIVLLENNVAVEVIDKIKEALKKELLEKPILRSKIEDTIKKTLSSTIKEILDVPKLNLDAIIKKCKQKNIPCVFLIIGYNGAGKSITCAKLALKLKKKGYKPLLAAGDTFRSAGDIQLVEYGKMVDVPVVYNPDTKDSCAVIFDAIQQAKSQHFDLVIADTSGRIHSNINLMDELKKIARVNNPDVTILILDSLTGSDVIQQMQEFDKAIAVDGVIFTKVDADEKGGAFLSAVYTGKKPVLYIGCGQLLSDLKEFNVDEILKNLGL